MKNGHLDGRTLCHTAYALPTGGLSFLIRTIWIRDVSLACVVGPQWLLRVEL